MPGRIVKGWDPGKLPSPTLVRLVLLISGRDVETFADRVVLRSPQTVENWLAGKSAPPRYLRDTLERIARRANQEGRVEALLPLLDQAERLEED